MIVIIIKKKLSTYLFSWSKVQNLTFAYVHQFWLDKFLDCHDKGFFILEGKFSESNASDFSEFVENRIFHLKRLY